MRFLKYKTFKYFANYCQMQEMGFFLLQPRTLGSNLISRSAITDGTFACGFWCMACGRSESLSCRAYVFSSWNLSFLSSCPDRKTELKQDLCHGSKYWAEKPHISLIYSLPFSFPHSTHTHCQHKYNQSHFYPYVKVAKYIQGFHKAYLYP